MRTEIPMRRNLLVMLTTVATAQRDLVVLSPTSGLCQGFMSAVKSTQVLARQAKMLANNARVSPGTSAYFIAAAKLTPGVTLSRAGGRRTVTTTFHHARYAACEYVPVKGTNPTVTLGKCCAAPSTSPQREGKV